MMWSSCRSRTKSGSAISKLKIGRTHLHRACRFNLMTMPSFHGRRLKTFSGQVRKKGMRPDSVSVIFLPQSLSFGVLLPASSFNCSCCTPEGRARLFLKCVATTLSQSVERVEILSVQAITTLVASATHVGYWHLADIDAGAEHVRSGG
jgi:hypothetical protein